jgi:mannosyltransferase
VVAVGLSSIVAMVVLAGHLAVLLVRRRRSLLPWSLVALVALVALTPLIWWGLHQRAAQLHWVTSVTLGEVYSFPARLVGSTEVAWLLIGLFLVAVLARARAVADTALVALAPAAVVLAVSATGTSFWVIRYLLFVLNPAAVVAAAGLSRLVGERHRWPGLAVALGVFAAAAVPGQLAVRQPNVKNGSDYRAMAALIRKGQQPGDDIVLQKGRVMRAGLDYYLRGDRGRPQDVLESRSAAGTGTLIADEYPDVATRLATATRIWLVVAGHPKDPASGRPDLEGLLHAGFERAGRWTVSRGTLALYLRRSPTSPTG